jgi:hypothetical protein
MAHTNRGEHGMSYEGRRGRRPLVVAALAAAVACAAPAAAGAETLFDQVDATSPQSINSQDFPASNDSFDAMAADDFVVPAGQTWKLDAALARGSNSGTGAAATARITIFADAAGAPGAQVFSTVAPVTNYPRMELTFAGPTLNPGTYWVGFQAILDPGTSAPFSQWFWAENSERAGALSMYRNPGDGFDTGCTTFTLKSACPFGAETHLAPDQSFSLGGTRTITTPPPPPGESEACKAARAQLDKAKSKLKKAKAKLADAKGDAKDRAKEKVKKAKAKVKKAKASVAEGC